MNLQEYPSVEWKLVPGECIGPIVFGASVADLGGALVVREDENDFDGTDRWIWYSTDSGDVLIQTCNGVIVTVICERACTFRGKNLVGISEAEVHLLFADHAAVEGAIPELEMIEIPDLGLQFRLSDGYVESITMGVDPDVFLERRTLESE